MVFSVMIVNKIDSHGNLYEVNMRGSDIMSSPAMKSKIESFITSLSDGLDNVVSKLLLQLREATSADAGSIYIMDNGALRCLYAQNDLLQLNDDNTVNDINQDKEKTNLYLGQLVRIDSGSICGYSASTKKPLMIDDVEKIPDSANFRYNNKFDICSGYRTVSVLTCPIMDNSDDILGVLQLINRKDKHGFFTSFDDWMLEYVLTLVKNFLPMISYAFEKYKNIGEHLNVKKASIEELYNNMLIELENKKKWHSKLPWIDSYEMNWTKLERYKEANVTKRLLAYSSYINQFEDVNTIMELMLTEAMDSSSADGGTVYLVEHGKLRFSYVRNDTLFKDDSLSRPYLNSELPIDASSLSGYSVVSGKPLNIPDVENLDGFPFKFNRAYDNASGYQTISALTVPVFSMKDNPIAVLQLINSKNSDGSIKPFDAADERYIELMTGQTMPFILRSIMTKSLIESMLKISNLRDPLETAGHVNRVGAYSAEIYNSWAMYKKLDKSTIRYEMDILRLAAMLHDIGKVAIPDAILKKTSKLDEDEFAIMRSHCYLGAMLYAKPVSKLEKAAYEITLNHHQRWDGNGYSGSPDCHKLKGEEIPLFARIVTVADVIDALLSQRSYKKAWTFEEAMAEIGNNSGTQFDPEVVEAAFRIKDTLKAISKFYL